MNDLYRRWFEPPSVRAAVSSMLRKFGNVPREQSDEVQNERDRLKTKYTVIAAGGAVVFLVVLIGVLVLFAPKPEGREANYGGLALLCLGVVAAAGGVTYFSCGNNNIPPAERTVKNIANDIFFFRMATSSAMCKINWLYGLMT